MAGRLSYGIGEYGKEPTGFSVAIPELTATNMAAQTTLITNFRIALGDIIVGTVQEQRVVSSVLENTALFPNDKNAQRERKWTVAYHDSQLYLDAPTNTVVNPGYNKSFTTDIPTADLSLLLHRTDTVEADDPDIGTELAAFIVAWEALVKSPYSGSTQVDAFVAAGRDL